MKKLNLIDAVIVAFLAIMALCVLLAANAYAQVPCAERQRVIDRLGGVFGEVQVATGIAANGAAFEVYVSPEGTWTVFTSSPDGLSCLLASGHEWSGFGALATKSEAH